MKIKMPVAAACALLGTTLFVSGCQSEAISDKMTNNEMSDGTMIKVKMTDSKMGMENMMDGKMTGEMMANPKMSDGKMAGKMMDK